MAYRLTATAADVSGWQRELSEEYLTCRDLGHTWRPAAARYLPDQDAYERTMRCGRCTTTREQLISRAGLILSGHYEYPDGYTVPAGTGFLSADARGSLRIESITRLIARDTEAPTTGKRKAR